MKTPQVPDIPLAPVFLLPMRAHYIPSRPPSLGNPPHRLWGMAGCRCRISLRQSITSRIVAFGKGETMPRKAMPDLDPEKLSSYLESVSGTPLRILSLTPLGETVATCAVKGDGSPPAPGSVGVLFLLVEHVEGSGYTQDLARLQAGENLTDLDLARADALCDYLADIHRETGTD